MLFPEASVSADLGSRFVAVTAFVSVLLCLDEGQQRTIGRRGRDANGGATADTGTADRLLRGGKVGCRQHEARTAALGQSCQRDFRIAPAQLVFRQKYEIGTIRTGRHRDSAV